MRHDPVEPRLIALSDFARFDHCLSELRKLCEESASHTVAVVLRDRELTLRKRHELGRTMRDFTRATGQFLMVADRLDLCLALDADGVHLGCAALLPSSLRNHVSWLSRSWHGVATLPQAELEQLDAVLVSPAFADLKGNSALGSDGLADCLRLLKDRSLARPPKAYALGRVDASNCSIALAQGCFGVASTSGVLTPQPRGELLEQLAIARQERRSLGK